VNTETTLLTDPTAGHVPQLTCPAALDLSKASIKVFLMDLWCYVPYYDRYLCEGLAREHIDVTLGSVCPYQDPKYFSRNGLANDPGLIDLVPKLGLSNDTTRRLLMLVESCVNMAALLARFTVSKPDIVHVQWIPLVRRLPFELWFLRAVKKLGIKLVYTAHNILPHDTGIALVPIFNNVYKQMDAIVCHTQEAKRRLIREFSVDPERVTVIAHGPLLHDAKLRSVPASKAQLSVPQDKVLVIWQGIIRSYKGLEFLLESWRKVDSLKLNAQLLIAGTGDSGLLEAIREQVSRLNLEESVRLDFKFIPDEDLPTYYQASDILVYPYREVTTSGALMTALAYGKPIVATALPAFREVLRDGKNAFLVNYGDVDGLADMLTRLIQNPKERERLTRGLATSDNFENSWTRIARQTRQLYTTVLQSMPADVAGSESNLARIART
jgi:glycosyltransferase involved in cell wall biosynthesis